MPPDASGPIVLPCACANLRRAARAVTRLYNHELRSTGLEATQYALLMALHAMGEATQGRLGAVLSLDTTSLTRMLEALIRQGWVNARPGEDRRQRLLQLTVKGEQKLRESRPSWERAQQALRTRMGDRAWNQMGPLLAAAAQAAE